MNKFKLIILTLSLSCCLTTLVQPSAIAQSSDGKDWEVTVLSTWIGLDPTSGKEVFQIPVNKKLRLKAILNQRSSRNQIGDGDTIFTLSAGTTVYLTNIQPIQVNR